MITMRPANHDRKRSDSEIGKPDITRRRVLQGIAAGGALGASLGTASAQPDRPRYNIGVTQSQAAANAVRNRAQSVHRELDFGDIGRMVSGRFSQQAREALAQRADVRYVEEDGQYHAIAETLPWGVDRIDADLVHADGRTGFGADIAILDTGIDSNHPDLQSNLGTGNAFVNCDSAGTGTCNEPWDDDNGHGTHVAGTADAVDNTEGVIGVSTNARLHAVKVLNENGSGSWSDLAAGINWVADQGYDVIDMSLGGSAYSDTVADACLYAYMNDVLLVAASGNTTGGCNNCVSYPAKYTTVMAVSASDSSDNLASFANTGDEVELIAPGVDILSAWNDGGYNTISGTSMASPHVAGTAGQLMALNYENTVARNMLRTTAENLGLPENDQGYGLVDADAAVPDIIGETGWVNVNQSDTDDWKTVNLEESYSAPTVIMKPVSFNGGHPCHVRLRNVSSTSFEFKIEEWMYLDGAHTEETIHWLVMERGVHTLGDGTVVVAGYLDGVDHNWSTASYGYTFDTEPVSITCPQTFNGSDPIVSRQRNIGTSSLEWRIQEEQARGAHTAERVGTILMEPGTNDLYGTAFEMDRTADTVTDEWHTINFDQEYGTLPIFLADMQTFDGPDPVGLRFSNFSNSSVDVFVEEEQSYDSETNHTTEEVGYMALEIYDDTFSGDKGAILGHTESGSEGLSFTGDAGIN